MLRDGVVGGEAFLVELPVGGDCESVLAYGEAAVGVAELVGEGEDFRVVVLADLFKVFASAAIFCRC